MTDQTTHRKLALRDGGIAGPYVMVSLGQLPAVESALRLHHVDYWVDQNAIAINGGPMITVGNFGRAGQNEQ